MPILPKFKPKFIQQHHNLPTLSKFHHDQRKNNTSKNTPKPTFPNMINLTMPPKFQNNQMTISHHETFNETCNNPGKEIKEKTHLGVHMTIWSMEPRVLEKSLIIIPIKFWIIFLTTRSKKRRSLGGRSNFDAKKMGFGKWVSPKMGVWWKCSKHKNLKKY